MIEYGEKDLLSFAVHPGSVMTELGSKMQEDIHADKFQDFLQ